MGLPPYITKMALSAATVLRDFRLPDFLRDVERMTIGVECGRDASATAEGRTACEMTVNLLARFYSRLYIVGEDPTTVALLRSQAAALNPDVILAEPDPGRTVALVLGDRRPLFEDRANVFVGSTGWLAHIDDVSPRGFSASPNPFGAAAAACIAVANAFRTAFSGQLARPDLDRELTLSTLTFERGPVGPNPALPTVDIGRAAIAGVGAIGSAAVWCLARVPALTGHLALFDPETIQLHNGQRYLLATPETVGRAKVDVARDVLSGTALSVKPLQRKWGGAEALGAERVLVSIDSARGRCEVQSSLPRFLVNAWTQPLDLGVTWHDFVAGPCVACLYIPDGPLPNEDEIIADALNVRDMLMDVRVRLHKGTAIGRDLIEVIAQRRRVADVSPLMQFENLPLREFYREVFCGGVIFGLESKTEGPTEQVHVPAAFQSALAGVLAGSGLVANATGLPHPRSAKGILNLLAPLGTELLVPLRKHVSGRCICQDQDYIETYQQKWRTAAVR